MPELVASPLTLALTFLLVVAGVLFLYSKATQVSTKPVQKRDPYDVYFGEEKK